MSEQAKNSLRLYIGGNPSTIEQLLSFQRDSVVKELKEHFGVSDIKSLALRLSLGR